MRYIFLTVVFVLFSSAAWTQQNESELIANAFRSGDINSIANYFPSNLDMTVVETEDVFSKAQAIQILNRFFKENQPNGFIIKHQGSSQNNDFYQIGTLKTTSGDFRVTYFIRKDGNEILIKRLRIESNEADF
jgi:hypothetical protein